MFRFTFRKLAGKAGYGKNLSSLSTIRPLWIKAGAAVMVLAAGIALGYVLTTKTVTLADNGKEVVIKTRSASVSDLLAERRIQLGPVDRVLPGPATRLVDGSRVEIKRAYHITLVADRETSEFYSSADTVKDILEEKKVALGSEDMVKPDVSEIVSADTEIRVVRVRNETEKVHAPIAFDVRRVPNPEMARGISRTVSRGQNGEEEQTWRITYHDGQVVSRSMVDRKTVASPTEAVLQVGTGQTVSRGGETIRFREAMDVIATSYSYTGYRTATGHDPEYGVVAVDPSVIPLGTRMYVEGYGYATALDTGGAIRGKRIDVFLESQAEASHWGVRSVRVYLVD